MARSFSVSTSQRLTAPDSTGLRTPSTAITIGGWFYLRNDSQPGAWLIGKQLSGSLGRSYGLEITDTPGGVQFVITDGVFGFWSRATTVPLNEWLFIAAVWTSGAGLRLRVWNLAGTRIVDTTGAAVSTTIGYSAHPLFVGQAALGARFSGYAEKVGVHSAALGMVPNLDNWRKYGTPPTLAAGFWNLSTTGTDVEPDTSPSADDPLTPVGYAAGAGQVAGPGYSTPPPAGNAPPGPTLGTVAAGVLPDEATAAWSSNGNGGSPIRYAVVTARPI